MTKLKSLKRINIPVKKYHCREIVDVNGLLYMIQGQFRYFTRMLKYYKELKSLSYNPFVAVLPKSEGLFYVLIKINGCEG